MKRWLVPLMLALAMVFASLPGLAEDGALTLEVNTAKLPLYDAADPAVAGLLPAEAAGDGLPVLLIQTKKSVDLKVTVLPKEQKNKKVTLTAAEDGIVKISGVRITGAAPGTTVVTVASQADPSATAQYRVVVTQPIGRIGIKASAKSVGKGESMTLTAEISPTNATNQQIKWSSANPDVATVDENGTVTGVKRGTARILAEAQDGSKMRANISVTVTQNAEEITLNQSEITVSAGKTAVVKATVLPKETNDKNVIWSSSDESIATVNAQGRVSGVTLGDCEIICTSRSTDSVQAKVTVHVQQPVKKIVFGEEPTVYAGETGTLQWTVEPADASNPSLTFSSSNRKILQVSQDGTVTGLKAGTATVSAVSTDGTNRRANIKVHVLQHVEGVHMKRNVAYISRGETSTTGAELEPRDASNKNMTWTSGDETVATVDRIPKQGNRVKITGVRAGETVVKGVTEDGGFETSIRVRVGDWDNALKLTDAYVKGADQYLTVKNNSDLNITSITAEVSVFDVDGNPVSCNSKDGSGTFEMVYKRTLLPGEATKESGWKYVNFKLPDSMTVSTYVVTVTKYQIDNDWVKTIRKKFQPTKKCPVHI